MRVDQDAVVAIKIKCERAQKNLLLLNEELRQWLAREPHRIRAEVNAKGAQHRLRLAFLEPIDPEWSVMLGEAIHNLRSALDQTIYWLSIDYKRVELTDTQFPIFTKRLGDPKGHGPSKRPGFEGYPNTPLVKQGGLYYLRGVGPGPRAFIEKIQPYPQRNGPLPKSLLSLHNFWNQDKHRLVHLWGLAIIGKREVKVTRPRGVNIVGTPWVNPGYMKANAIVAKVTIDPPHPDVHMGLKTGVSIAIKNARGGERRAAKVTLDEMLLDTAAVCARLLLTLGRQDEPVSMDPIPETERGVFSDV